MDVSDETDPADRHGSVERVSISHRRAIRRGTQVSAARRAAVAKVLGDLEAWIAPRPIEAINPNDLAGFVDARLDDGFHPNTVRKWLVMSRTFCSWLYAHGAISADTLLGLRKIPMPAGSSGCPRPCPYSRSELRDLQLHLEQRWPRLRFPDDRLWVDRWRAGACPYSRIRRHAIRLQTEAVIVLAAELGLRRSEIFALTVDAMHPDNAHVIVWRNGIERSEASRRSPSLAVRGARSRSGIHLRTMLGVDHGSPWVQLWSSRRVGAPMNRDAFERVLRTYVGEGVTFKRLRDTCAARWINAGLPIEHGGGCLVSARLRRCCPTPRWRPAAQKMRMHRVEELLEPAMTAA